MRETRSLRGKIGQTRPRMIFSGLRKPRRSPRPSNLPKQIENSVTNFAKLVESRVDQWKAARDPAAFRERMRHPCRLGKIAAAEPANRHQACAHRSATPWTRLRSGRQHAGVLEGWLSGGEHRWRSQRRRLAKAQPPRAGVLTCPVVAPRACGIAVLQSKSRAQTQTTTGRGRRPDTNPAEHEDHSQQCARQDAPERDHAHYSALRRQTPYGAK